MAQWPSRIIDADKVTRSDVEYIQLGMEDGEVMIDIVPESTSVRIVRCIFGPWYAFIVALSMLWWAARAGFVGLVMRLWGMK